MSAPLVTALEALSGYRPIYPAGESGERKNPIVWAHVGVQTAGKSWRILSRISDFGLDFSQRGNKLAHHVALEPGEQVACGPAALLMRRGFMETTWSGPPRVLPADKTIADEPHPPKVCSAWKRLTGDAGWGGTIAEGLMNQPDRPIYLEFAPGVELLPLIDEAIALLPIERRWGATFSTYYTSLPPGTACTLRCVVSGSPEADQGRSLPRALYLNLNEKLPPAAGGTLVELARHGPAECAVECAVECTVESDSTLTTQVSHTTVLTPSELNEFSRAPAGKSEEYATAEEPAVDGLPFFAPPPPPLTGRKRRRSRLAELYAMDATARQKLIRGAAIVFALLFVVVAVVLFAVPSTRNWFLARQTEVEDRSFDDSRPKEEPAIIQPKTRRIGEELGDQSIRRDDNQSSTAEKSASANDSSSNRDKKRAEQTTSSASERNETPEDEQPKKPIADSTNKHGNDAVPIGAPTSPKDSAEAPRPGLMPAPEFGSKTISIALEAERYELYYLPLAEAIEEEKSLKIPCRNPKDFRWSLFAPANATHLEIGKRDGDAQSILWRQEGGTRLESVPLVNISAETLGGDVVFQFRKNSAKSAPDWKPAHYCLLATRDGNELPRCFALRPNVSQLSQNQFQDDVLSLPFDWNGKEFPLNMLQHISLDVQVMAGVRPLHFSRDGDARENLLQCEIPNEAAAALLLNLPARFDIELSVRGKESRLSIVKSIRQMSDLYRSGLAGRLTPLLKEPGGLFGSLLGTTTTQELASGFFNQGVKDSNFKRIKKELQSNAEVRKKALKNLDSADPNLAPNIAQLKQQIEQIENLTTKLKEIEDSKGRWNDFIDALSRGKVLGLTARYNVRVELRGASAERAESWTVPIEWKLTPRRESNESEK